MRIAVPLAAFFSGFIIPVRFFPEWLRTVAYATPFPSMLQLPIDVFVGVTTGPSSSPRSRAGRLGCSRSSPPATRLLARHPKAGGAGWLSRFALYVRLVSARVRAQWQYRHVVRPRRRGRVPRLVPRLHRHPRHLRQRAAARRLERAGGRAPLRHRRRLVLDRRAVRRPPRSAAAADPRRELRPRADPAARLAAPGDRLRFPSASGRKAPQSIVVLVYAVVALDIGWTVGSRRHDRRGRARRRSDLRRHLGGGHHHRLLGRRGTRGGERVHRRWTSSRSTRSTSTPSGCSAS